MAHFECCRDGSEDTVLLKGGFMALNVNVETPSGAVGTYLKIVQVRTDYVEQKLSLVAHLYLSKERRKTNVEGYLEKIVRDNLTPEQLGIDPEVGLQGDGREVGYNYFKTLYEGAKDA